MSRWPIFLALAVTLLLAACDDAEVEPQPGNGIEGVFELTGPALEWPLPVGAPVRVGIRQRFVGTQEQCNGGVISEEDCFIPAGYLRLDVHSIVCEAIECEIEAVRDSDPREPEFLITAMEPGNDLLSVTIAAEGFPARDDSWPIEARTPEAIRVSRRPLADAGTHHAAFVGARIRWDRRLVAQDEEGREVGLARTDETITMELEGDAYRVDDYRADAISLIANRPGSGRVHLRGGSLQRTLELSVADRFQVSALEVVPMPAWAPTLDDAPVDVDVDPLEDPPLDSIVIDRAGKQAFALRALFDDGTQALGGAVTLSAMPMGHLFMLPLGADAYFTLEPYSDGEVLLEASVGDVLLAVDVSLRGIPDPGF